MSRGVGGSMKQSCNALHDGAVEHQRKDFTPLNKQYKIKVADVTHGATAIKLSFVGAGHARDGIRQRFDLPTFFRGHGPLLLYRCH